MGRHRMGSPVARGRFFASFSIGANDNVTSLVGFFLMFGLPIVASVAGDWTN